MCVYRKRRLGMKLYQGYKSNVICDDVEDVEEAAEIVRNRHPELRVFAGIDGLVINAVRPGVGCISYGLSEYAGAQSGGEGGRRYR